MEIQKLQDSVSIKKVSEKDNVGNFSIEGLYTGYGLTIGNALRRVLLSSIPGAAIIQVKIKGVSHEFSTLQGMVEDMIELSLNLKRVRLKIHTDEPQTLMLKVKGEKEVTAADIKTTTFVEVINPDCKIATLTKKNSELDMEIVAERGLGYLPSDQRKMGRLPVGTIMLDAIYTPIRRVDFKIEDMRVGERTNYNRINIEVETDGSVSPGEAVQTSLIILKEHYEKILDTDIFPIEESQPEEENPKKKKVTAKKTAKKTTVKKK